MIIHSEIIKSYNSDCLEQLNTEVTALKKTAMFMMLKDGSSSDRIQAVNYTDGIKNPDQPVIDVLVNTLNNDKNVNVRMAAAYALARYADQKPVCDSLVNSLYHQDDPILQVTLINILVERKAKSAIKPIQQIISDKSTIKEVKDIAESSLKLLI
jgi:HEAT repeat protein